MRHRVDHRKLGRTAAHRKAMLANMVMSLFEQERISTTDAKAKEARRTAERLITRAKKGYAAFQEHKSLKDAGKESEAKQMQAVALAHWRQASRVIRKKKVLKKLFDELAPLYMERNGGYTRILHTGNRLGDNAKTVLLELVDSQKAAAKAERGSMATSDDVIGDADAKPKRKTKSKKKEDKVAAAPSPEEAVEAAADEAPEPAAETPAEEATETDSEGKKEE